MIKKLFLIFIALMLSVSVMGCVLNGIDLNDTSHDDDYIVVSLYYEVDKKTGELVQKVYLPTINELRFYESNEIGNLELYVQTNEIRYQLYGNYNIKSKTSISVYVVSDLKWENIPETAWHESNQRLNDDVLSTYGTLPILATSYKLSDVIRVIYQDNNLWLHYMVARTDTRLFIRYGDLRTLLSQ